MCSFSGLQSLAEWNNLFFYVNFSSLHHDIWYIKGLAFIWEFITASEIVIFAEKK